MGINARIERMDDLNESETSVVRQKDATLSRKPAQKNGTVEVLRFVFAICIVGVHLYGISNLDYFKYGHYGVEFFFLLSGFLMAQSIEKHLSNMQEDIGKSTYTLVLKKIKKIFPYVVLVTIVAICAYALKYRQYQVWDIEMDLINLIPYLFFTNMAGLGAPTPMYVGVMWYLSALFLSMLILAPIYIKYNSYAKYVLFPLLGFFILGFLIRTGNTYTFTTEDPWGIHLGMLRALGEMALGASCYTVAMHIKKQYDLTFIGKILILAIELLCFVLILIFINGKTFYDSPSVVLFLFLILLILVFSGICWNIPDVWVVSFLGIISLPLYLTHIVVIYSILLWNGTDWIYGKEWITLTMIFLLTIMLYLIAEYVLPKMSIIKQLFIKS